MVRDTLDIDQSVVWAAASLADTSMSWPPRPAWRWSRAQTAAKAPTSEAMSPERWPGGISGSRSGTPAFQHKPEVASITDPHTSRPA